jgi:hypothetical protein
LEAIQEKLDRKAVLDELKEDVMEAAEKEFYWETDRRKLPRTNPWAAHKNMKETMFWL